VSVNKISIVSVFIICFFCFNDSFCQAKQAPSKSQKATVTISKAEAEIDSLNKVIDSMNASYRDAVKRNQEKKILIDDLGEKIIKAHNLNIELEKKLSDFKGDNLKLDQSNRILIIFNALVGLLLLITLVWFLRNIGRKKAKDKNKAIAAADTPAPSGIAIQPGLSRDQQYFDYRLEQLEKLGQLKQNGILTDEEFNRQKQQILGNM
jgi:hypothetical protein